MGFGQPAPTVSDRPTFGQVTGGASLRGAVSQPTFTPDARALVFVDSSSSGASRRLRYLSIPDGNSTELGQWKSSLLAQQYGSSCNDPRTPYPIDPSGCFLLVDSDVSPGPGTSLVLLP